MTKTEITTESSWLEKITQNYNQTDAQNNDCSSYPSELHPCSPTHLSTNSLLHLQSTEYTIFDARRL